MIVGVPSESGGVAYDLFNGDADGICALHQLRLLEPADSQLLTGVKRDIALFEKLATDVPVQVVALDISFDRNEAALRQVLASGGKVRYFDHHSACNLFSHPQLECHIDTTSDVCTSLLVDRYIGGRFRLWTIVAAYGDNLLERASRLANDFHCSVVDARALEQLGYLLNYNAYGETVADLHLHPADLYRSLHRFESPLDFLASAPEYKVLAEGFAADQQYLKELTPCFQTPSVTVYVLPDAAWARRLSGTLANQLVRSDPDHSFAVLTPCTDGAYTVSVRMAAGSSVRADIFCGRYPGGGGRHIAGGIENLPASEVGNFIDAFELYVKGVMQ